MERIPSQNLITNNINNLTFFSTTKQNTTYLELIREMVFCSKEEGFLVVDWIPTTEPPSTRVATKTQLFGSSEKRQINIRQLK